MLDKHDKAINCTFVMIFKNNDVTVVWSFTKRSVSRKAKLNREYLHFQNKLLSIVTEGCCVLSFVHLSSLIKGKMRFLTHSPLKMFPNKEHM